MIRAAAKNHADVTVVVEPADYAAVLAEMAAHNGMTIARVAPEAGRQSLCAHRGLRRRDLELVRRHAARRRAGLPRLRRQAVQALRYGENPHQTRGFYRTPSERSGVATARQVQGKELSYNNINDTDAAYECVAEFDPQAHRRLRHRQACQSLRRGGRRKPASRPIARRWPATPISAFGGIVALNRTLDAEAARAITEIFTEVIIAPDATEEAIAIVARQEESAAAAGRRPARSARHGLTAKIGRRRIAGAVARQRRRSTTWS